MAGAKTTDTNILIRNAIENDPAYPLVHEALERLIQNRWELCIGTQILVELWVVATRPTEVNGLGLSPTQAQQEIARLMATYTLLRDPQDMLERWLDLCSRYGVSGRPAHDARLVALMPAHGVTHPLTLNPANFARYAEITCLTPDRV